LDKQPHFDFKFWERIGAHSESAISLALALISLKHVPNRFETTYIVFSETAMVEVVI